MLDLQRGLGAASGQRQTNHSILDVIPQDAGPRLTTFRGGAVHSVREPSSQAFHSDSHFVAVMLAPSPGMTSSLGSDRPRTFDAYPGMIVVSPAQVDSTTTWLHRRENISVAIRPESLIELAEQELDISNRELQPPPFGTIDPTALHVAQLLKAELKQQQSPNELFVDSLITVLAIHVLRNYTGGQGKRTFQRGLSQTGAARIQEFLAENFTRKLSVAELAAVCDLSPGHFIRAFSKTFGEPPHKYLLNLRLSFAEKLLYETNMTIAEIAYLSGFSSQSHLTSTMAKTRQITPAIIRGRR